MSHALAVASVSALCISYVLGAESPPCEPFTIPVPCWSTDLKLQHCDIEIPQFFHVQVFEELKLCHAGILALQKSTDPKVQVKLLTDGSPNVFFCSKQDKKFIILTHKDGQWERKHLSQIPQDLVGTKARFFAPFKA